MAFEDSLEGVYCTQNPPLAPHPRPDLSMTDPIHPRSPDSREMDAALGRLLAPPGSSQPAPSTVRNLKVSLREERGQLWCAGPYGAPEGAVLALPRPGKIEMLLTTPLGPADNPQPTGLCLQAALAAGRKSRNHLTQLVHLPEAVGTAEAAKFAGMEWLAELQFLRTPSVPEPMDTPSGNPQNKRCIEWCLCEKMGRKDLQDLLLQTYVDAKDCPGLRGRREPKDILIGHEASGINHHWVAAQMNNECIGVLLLAESPERHLLQVLYVGIVPKHRGKSLGQHFMKYAYDKAIAQKLPLSLHVDRQNTPALRLYQRFGLQARESRVAWIADIRKPIPSTRPNT